MSQGIYLIQSDKSLVELSEEAYDSEDLLQELLAEYPNLLSGNQPNSEKPGQWLLIKREMGIPDSEESGNRWALDHLFIDQGGIPILVEVKRASDSRIRREVVGQMLDYAANAIKFWPLEKIKAELENAATRKGVDPNAMLQEFLGMDQDVDEFWQRVKTNLLGGRVRMVFVADSIPGELQRIIEFMNQQMNPAEVYAVEFKQYAGEGIRSLVPRIIGDSSPAKTSSSKGWDRTSFLDCLLERGSQQDMEFGEQLINWAEKQDLRIWWGSGSSDGSFYAMFHSGSYENYTFAVRTGYKNPFIQLQFSQQREPFANLDQRRILADKIQSATGRNLTDEDLNKYPSIMFSALDQQKLDDFLAVFDWYLDQLRAHIAASAN